MPGEQIEQRDGELFLNNHSVEEPYVQCFDQGDVAVWNTGSGYLILGDNRRESRDGRTWGPLKSSAFLGRVLGV